MAFDAIIVLGGGVTDQGTPPPHVQARLDLAIELTEQTEYFITTSRGTNHKPAPRNEQGFAVDESVASANYLIGQGISAKKIFQERLSFDSVGNAFFTRVLFTDILDLKNLLVITSEFHLARTKAIFEIIYNLEPDDDSYQVEYKSVPNIGFTEEEVAARMEREQNSIQTGSFFNTEFNTMQELTKWMFTEHGTYRANLDYEVIDDKALKTY